jgi:hypothetical protein
MILTLLPGRSFMANARRFFSSALAALMVATAGCSSSDLLTLGNLRLQTVDSAPAVAPPAPPQLRAATTDEKVIIKPASVVVQTLAPETSEWCRYVNEDAAAQATILRSPSVSGSMTNKGRAGLTMSLSAVGFNRARLVEKAAEVKCRQHLAEDGLQKLVFVSPQGLTAAGFRAKSNAIEKHLSELKKLRAEVKRELAQGNITVERATSLTVLIDQIAADGKEAKSQADRRLNEGMAEPQAAKALGAELLRAEAELDDLNSAFRSSDNMDLSVSAGWNDPDIAASSATTGDSFSGKVSFSIKLGAIAPQRFRHERLAKQARLNAIGNQEGGMLWQIDLMRRANERALDGLEASRRKLAEAILDADRLVAVSNTNEDAEFSGMRIAARIQRVRLMAERAGIEGSIAEIHANIVRLKLG